MNSVVSWPTAHHSLLRRKTSRFPSNRLNSTTNWKRFCAEAFCERFAIADSAQSSNPMTASGNVGRYDRLAAARIRTRFWVLNWAPGRSAGLPTVVPQLHGGRRRLGTSIGADPTSTTSRRGRRSVTTSCSVRHCRVTSLASAMLWMISEGHTLCCRLRELCAAVLSILPEI
jgi:hypothetical protein